MRRLLVALATLATLLPAAAHAETINCRWALFIDGDSMRCDAGYGQPYHIRLYGIDAPELHQPGGELAAQAANDLIAGLAVSCVSRGLDRYGRILATCATLKTMDIGGALVGAGWAWCYRQYDPLYCQREAEARAARRGIWLEPGAVPPWDWRRAKRH